MTDEPTDEALENLFVEETGFDIDDFPAAIFDFARAVLAKWGQPAQAAEPVAWLDPWTGTKVTTDYDAYGKHGIPLVRQQPVVREPLTDEQMAKLYRQSAMRDRIIVRGDWEQGVRDAEAAHGIKGGQHGTE